MFSRPCILKREVVHHIFLCYDASMHYKTLETTPIEVIYDTFIDAFSDYQIPVQMSLEEFVETNDQRSVILTDSFGAFTEEGKLVGFVLNGVRMKEDGISFYDAGTAIVPSYRGKGIGSQLLTHTLHHAQKRGARAFILEVIKDNDRARELYEKQGFETTRSLLCFHKEKAELNLPVSGDFFTLDRCGYEAVASAIDLSYTPSWQNDRVSVNSIFDNLTVRGMKRNGEFVGYYVMYAKKGRVMNIAAKKNDSEIFAALFSDAASRSEKEKVNIINVEETSPLCRYLRNEGWSLFVEQWEMVRQFV